MLAKVCLTCLSKLCFVVLHLSSWVMAHTKTYKLQNQIKVKLFACFVVLARELNKK